MRHRPGFRPPPLLHKQGWGTRAKDWWAVPTLMSWRGCPPYSFAYVYYGVISRQRSFGGQP